MAPGAGLQLKGLEGVALGAIPPVDRWDPPFCGDMDLVIEADGTWRHQGAPIRRPALVRLFSTVLRREADGDYCLVTPVEKLRIQVEDAPFVGIALERDGEGETQVFTITTNVGDQAPLGADHPLQMRPGPDGRDLRPYVLVRGRLEARIARSVYYELAEAAVERATDQGPQLGLWSNGVFFSLQGRE